MKQFLYQNWYRISLAVAAFIFSFGFTAWTIKQNTAKAGEPIVKNKSMIQSGVQIVAVGRKIYAVTYDSSSDRYEIEHVGTAPQ